MSDVFAPLTLEARGLGCSRGGRRVFAGLSFRLGPGELIAATGPNGAGKSSLLRVLAGLVTPDGGEVSVLAEGANPDVGLIHYLGHSDGVKPAETLREALRFSGIVYQQGRVPLDSDMHEAAALVGLSHALDLPLGVFSAGQRRRAALARLALSPRPLWLLDEPTASLDAGGEAMLGGMMRRHLDAGGLVVAATHQRLPVAAHRTIEMGEGR